MIELNLVPDVKQELLQAQRVRNTVISIAIIVGVVSLGIVVILALYYFGGQTVRTNILDGQIKEKISELKDTDDLSNTLTIQNQLSKLSAQHDSKHISSRLFAILTAINPAVPNNIEVSSAKLDAETATVTIDGQASNGYEAAELFKKTILSTKMSYADSEGVKQSVPLTSDVSTSDISYGEDATGKKVLRFTMSFIYPEELFARSSKNTNIERPNRQNVTDSFLRIPQSLFSERASDLKGEEN